MKLSNLRKHVFAMLICMAGLFGGVNPTIAQTDQSAVLSVMEVSSYCVKAGIGGGPCGNAAQFAEVDRRTVRYWYQPTQATASLITKNCSAVFAGIPDNYYVLYMQQDGTYQDGSGQARLDNVCWLVVSLDPLSAP